MLIYRRTSLLESSAQTLVNTVNTVGVMGKGLAREFRDRYPTMFHAYKEICDQGLLTPGRLWLWKDAGAWVLNFPTKKHWKNPSKIEWIEAGLERFVAGFEELGIREISFPRLGCGNGGLDWTDVKPVMEHYLSPLKIPVYIHDYSVDVGLPEHLEAVTKALASEVGAPSDFDGFKARLLRAITLSGDELVDLQTKEPIKASIDDEGLTLSTSGRTWTFEPEDLWGVWIALQKGFLTAEKAGWTDAEGGRPLLSLLSLLPNVRPIEVQRFAARTPELAVEIKPNNAGAPPSAAEQDGQLALQWR